MRRLVVFCAAALLVGCTTAEIEQGKDLARKSIDVVCTSYPAPHFAFMALAASGRLRADLIEKERLAVVALEAICATKTAIAAASRVFTALLNAAAEARRQAATS